MNAEMKRLDAELTKECDSVRCSIASLQALLWQIQTLTALSEAGMTAQVETLAPETMELAKRAFSIEAEPDPKSLERRREWVEDAKLAESRLAERHAETQTIIREHIGAPQDEATNKWLAHEQTRLANVRLLVAQLEAACKPSTVPWSATRLLSRVSMLQLRNEIVRPAPGGAPASGSAARPTSFGAFLAAN